MPPCRDSTWNPVAVLWDRLIHPEHHHMDPLFVCVQMVDISWLCYSAADLAEIEFLGSLANQLLSFRTCFLWSELAGWFKIWFWELEQSPASVKPLKVHLK